MGDVVGRYLDALRAGDTDAIVDTFAPDGYFREPMGPSVHPRGAAELRSFFARRFSPRAASACSAAPSPTTGALRPGIQLLQWGTDSLPAQAGIAVYERDADGLLAAARIYDDVQAPYHRN